MIKNERQYRITKAEADKFERLITDLEVGSAADLSIPAAFRKAEIDGLRSQLADLRNQIQEYDDLRSGKHVLLETISFQDLPRTLVKARIASGWSQKQLAEQLNLKEQQVQKYEATGYAGASMSRLGEVADALGLKVRKDVFLPTNQTSSFDVFKRLRDMGLDREFILNKLMSKPVADKAKLPAGARDPEVVFQATAMASHIYGWTPEAIIGNDQLFIDQGVLGAARFKVTAKAEQKRLSAYTFYAHFLALHLLEATTDLPPCPIPTDYKVVRAGIIKKYGSITLRTALHYVWDLGVPVLPLNDPGAFHGAMWRVGGRNVIVLKQATLSSARWLHDLIHELFHAGQEPAKPERTIIEAAETSSERRDSDEEWDATQLAADVVLDGKAEPLAKLCVERTRKQAGASGSLERLKSIVPMVAKDAGVPADALANYMAFRLSLQNVDWWGTAQNLQDMSENPWAVARDVLLERAKLGRVAGIDRDLLTRALADPDD